MDCEIVTKEIIEEKIVERVMKEGDIVKETLMGVEMDEFFSDNWGLVTENEKVKPKKMKG